MATKNHELDGRIKEAAYNEFLKHGYSKSSIYKICDAAGVTTGAIYTRYQSKDDLFCSLVREALKKIKTKFGPVIDGYDRAKRLGTPEALLEALRNEQKEYIELLFDYYDECVLFITKSDGSSMGTELKNMLDDKVRRTVSFFKDMGTKEVSYNGIELIVNQEFFTYKEILLKGYTKEEAIEVMNTVSIFLESGWLMLFKSIL